MEIKWTPENINNGMLQYLQDASNLYNESWNKGVNLILKLSKPELKKRQKYVKNHRNTQRSKQKKILDQVKCFNVSIVIIAWIVMSMGLLTIY